jgi:GNAT superfamily N-acetyltransferase
LRVPAPTRSSRAAGSQSRAASRSVTCSPFTSSAWSTSAIPPRSTSFSCYRPLTAKVIGDALLKLADAEFARRGCTNVALQLGRGNDGARAFYRRHGYDERAGFELLDKMLLNGENGQ